MEYSECTIKVEGKVDAFHLVLSQSLCILCWFLTCSKSCPKTLACDQFHLFSSVHLKKTDTNQSPRINFAPLLPFLSANKSLCLFSFTSLMDFIVLRVFYEKILNLSKRKKTCLMILWWQQKWQWHRGHKMLHYQCSTPLIQTFHLKQGSQSYYNMTLGVASYCSMEWCLS